MEQQEFFSQLKAAGVDTDTALERFMGNQGLYLRFLLQLPDILHFDEMQSALSAQDQEAFYHYIHTLKGTTSNLGVSTVGDCAHAILAELRTGGFRNMKKLQELLKEIETESERIVDLIHYYKGEEQV